MLAVDAPVIVVGAPRSGTTWLQRLLATPPEVVSCQEMNLFDKYIAPLDATFARQVRQLAERPRVKGLPALLSQSAYDDLLRSLVLGSYAELARLKPGASIVVDKNIPNTLHVPLIRRLLPQARFVHLVRDGRDVAASLVAAHAGWGRRWAPSRVALAAAVWRRHVQAAREGSTGADHYLEVRYEDLRLQGPATLSRVFDFVGLAVDEVQAAGLLAEQALSAAGSASDPLVYGDDVLAAHGGHKPSEPEGFVRCGRSGSWQQWSPVDRVGFDEVAGDLLLELGYAADRGWATGPRWARPVAALQDGGHRVRTAVLRQARDTLRPQG